MIPGTLEEIFVKIYDRMEEIERRFENRERTGKVNEVDHEKGLARIELGKDENGQPFLSPWVPWKTPALGSTKINVPPSVGQQVKLVSESGDLTDAAIDNSLFSDEHPLPVVKPGEGIIATGKTTIFFSGDQYIVQTPHYRVETGKAEYVQTEGGDGEKPGAAVA